MIPRLFRLMAGIGLALAMLTTLAQPGRADETPTDPKAPQRVARDFEARRASAVPSTPTTPATPSTLSAAATAEENNAVARLNSYRVRAGLAPVTLVGTPGAVLNHAKYLDRNLTVPELDLFDEDPSLPGYTPEGAAIAVQTWPGWSEVGSYSQQVDQWISSGDGQYWELLNPTTRTVSFTRHGQIVLAWFQHHDRVKAPIPVRFPQGHNFNLTTLPDSLYDYYRQTCTHSEAYGFPITFRWPAAQYDQTTVHDVQMSVNGRGNVPVCIPSLRLPGQVEVLPQSPLPQGAHVKVQVRLTADSPDGATSQELTVETEFTVQAPVTATPGDQTGDKTADILAVTTTGDLMLYKGRQPGTIGHGFQIGRGWNQFTWFAHTPDVNGDHREDLIGRRADGHLYLYYGQGMGSYTAGKKVGQNWGALRNLTVVGDMNADGTPEVIGIGPEGNLYRYTLTANGFIGASLIGKNWQGIELTASVGSFNATTDPYADLIAVGTNGRLYAYYTGKNGTFIQAAVIGQGWTGFTALFSPGDLTGDNRPDLIGRNQTGTLYSYQNRSGSWGPARQAGTNWNGIRLFG